MSLIRSVTSVVRVRVRVRVSGSSVTIQILGGRLVD